MGGAPSPRKITRVANVTRHTSVGVVAQKNTHQASTYLRDVSAETLIFDGHGGA